PRRGRNDQCQDRLAGDDVRRRRAFVLRSDRPCRSDALRRKTLPQILHADARLLHRDAVMAASDEESRKDVAKYEALAEAAYNEMYDSRSPAACYSDLKDY